MVHIPRREREIELRVTKRSCRKGRTFHEHLESTQKEAKYSTTEEQYYIDRKGTYRHSMLIVQHGECT